MGIFPAPHIPTIAVAGSSRSYRLRCSLFIPIVPVTHVPIIPDTHISIIKNSVAVLWAVRKKGLTVLNSRGVCVRGAREEEERNGRNHEIGHKKADFGESADLWDEAPEYRRKLELLDAIPKAFRPSTAFF